MVLGMELGSAFSSWQCSVPTLGEPELLHPWGAQAASGSQPRQGSQAVGVVASAAQCRGSPAEVGVASPAGWGSRPPDSESGSIAKR